MIESLAKRYSRVIKSHVLTTAVVGGPAYSSGSALPVIAGHCAAMFDAAGSDAAMDAIANARLFNWRVIIV